MNDTETAVGRNATEFAELWAQYCDQHTHILPERGDVREGTILRVDGSDVLLDIGAKQDAVISQRELAQMSQEERQRLRIGARVQAYILRSNDAEEQVIVSLRLAAEYQDWLHAEELLASGEIVTAVITGYNRGGLLCSILSLQGFIPASQVVSVAARRLTSQPEVFDEVRDSEMVVKVLEVNRRRRRLILSERAAQHEWRAKQRERLFAQLEVGDRRKGVVSNLASFGAFVDLGGVDGLVHLSELSWGRLDHPGRLVRVGQEVEVEVLNFDRERQRIGLSLKRLQPDPWTTVEERYAPGQLVSGTVTHLVKFGAFVELEDGIEGLIHLSELAGDELGSVGSVVSEGQSVDLVVLSVDADHHRIALSLRQFEEPPEKEGGPAAGGPELGDPEAEATPAPEDLDPDLFDAGVA
jgi:small subunit ribosomal protein S1